MIGALIATVRGAPGDLFSSRELILLYFFGRESMFRVPVKGNRVECM